MTKNGSGGSRHSDKRVGSGHPNPEMGSGVVEKKKFPPFGPQFRLKIRDRGASPGSATEKYSNPYLTLGA